MIRPRATRLDETPGGREADEALAALLGSRPQVTGGDGSPTNPSPAQPKVQQGLGDGCDGCDGFPVTSTTDQRSALDLVEWALFSLEGGRVAPRLVGELHKVVRLPGRSWERPAVKLAARVWQAWRERLPVEADPLVVMAGEMLDARKVGR